MSGFDQGALDESLGADRPQAKGAGDASGSRRDGLSGGALRDCKRTSDPLSYCEMEAWSRLTGQTLEPGEVWCLMRLDDAHGRVTRG
ncbi:phage tail assembly chaperone [Pseudomonas sp. NPDC077408]